MKFREAVSFHNSRVKFMTLQVLKANKTQSLIRESNKTCEHLQAIENECQV